MKTLSNNPDLSDEELENVTGGTCFSSGVTDPETGETNEYAIVSPLNSCPLNSLTEGQNLKCKDCKCYFRIGPTWYCAIRWKGHNTAYCGFHPDLGPAYICFIDDPE